MKRIILFVLSLLFGLQFAISGLNKFFFFFPVPEDLPEAMQKMNAAIMDIPWLLSLIGVAEVIGGLLFIFSRTRALGAIIIFPVMCGILLTHIIVAPSGLPLALLLTAILLWVMIENRKKYAALF